ncbi:DUF1385 domain-containing protein [Alkaliphilus hydrothermalis]|uniref:Uncharacterized protein YqhQ n=1 Tax=Alkaliphilus hydrothermalis TaxID=1482730 RepID=A0ABS2NSY6_9FIRM|nr:DUF1385 domain-containing protein [Alkaliphilus hydrothermalis]MBM7616079.1 uncharacterized protein YqhQ [Alkaliphilus hydrothermalis]
MKLGGYAHSNGITFFCDVFKLKTTKTRGKTEHQLEWILPGKWLRKLEKKPIIGGISFFYYQWKIIDRRIRVALLLLMNIFILEEFVPLPFITDLLDAPPINETYLYGGLLLGFILSFRKISRLLRYHGAEHKVINSYLMYGSVDFSTVKEAPRFNKRCGSNLVMIFLILYGIIYYLNYDPLWLQLLLFLLTLQIFKKIMAKDSKYDYLINALQWITVWEPRDEEIQVAIKGFAKLHQSYIIYQKEVLERRQLKS